MNKNEEEEKKIRKGKQRISASNNNNNSGSSRKNNKLHKVNKQKKEERKEERKNVEKIKAEEISNKFPNFNVLNEEERVAFFKALTEARKNVERRGVATRERFGTVHDEYLKYYQKQSEQEEAPVEPSEGTPPSPLHGDSLVSSTPDQPSTPKGEISFEGSHSPKEVLPTKPEIWEQCESVIEEESNKMIDLYLKKTRKKREEKEKEEEERKKTKAEPQKTRATPRFDALNPEEREIFFRILQEAHDSVLQKNRGREKDVPSIDSILGRYKGHQEATSVFSTFNEKEKNVNLKVKVTLTSGDNERLKKGKMEEKVQPQESSVVDPTTGATKPERKNSMEEEDLCVPDSSETVKEAEGVSTTVGEPQTTVKIKESEVKIKPIEETKKEEKRVEETPKSVKRVEEMTQDLKGREESSWNVQSTPKTPPPESTSPTADKPKPNHSQDSLKSRSRTPSLLSEAQRSKSKSKSDDLTKSINATHKTEDDRKPKAKQKHKVEKKPKKEKKIEQEIEFIAAEFDNDSLEGCGNVKEKDERTKEIEKLCRECSCESECEECRQENVAQVSSVLIEAAGTENQEDKSGQTKTEEEEEIEKKATDENERALEDSQRLKKKVKDSQKLGEEKEDSPRTGEESQSPKKTTEDNQKTIDDGQNLITTLEDIQTVETTAENCEYAVEDTQKPIDDDQNLIMTSEDIHTIEATPENCECAVEDTQSPEITTEDPQWTTEDAQCLEETTENPTAEEKCDCISTCSAADDLNPTCSSCLHPDLPREMSVCNLNTISTSAVKSLVFDQPEPNSSSSSASSSCSSSAAAAVREDKIQIPEFTTGKVMLVDDNVVDRIRKLIYYLDAKVKKDDRLEREYMRLLVDYTEYLSRVLEALLNRKRRREFQTQKSFTAAEARLQFDPENKPKTKSNKKIVKPESILEKIPRSVSEQNLAKLPIATIGKKTKNEKNKEPQTEKDNISPELSDSDSSTTSDGVSRFVPLYSGEPNKVVTTKVRMLQDLLQERAEFVEGSIADFKVVYHPEKDFVPTDKPMSAQVLADEEEEHMQRTTNTFFKKLMRCCTCGRVKNEDEGIFENLKGEAVRVDIHDDKKRNAANATLNRSTMEVLKASERKKMIEKYYKKD